MDTTLTLEQELKRDRLIDRELNSLQYDSLEILMDNIEYLRKKRFQTFPTYTQEYVAKRAGISISTDTNYRTNASDKSRLKTLLRILETLGCDYTEIPDLLTRRLEEP